MTSMCPFDCQYRQINWYCQLSVCINPKYRTLRYNESVDVSIPPKEQDAVEPEIVTGIPVVNPHTGLEYDTVYKCGNCGMTLIGKANYCFKCGTKVKWNMADFTDRVRHYTELPFMPSWYKEVENDKG